MELLEIHKTTNPYSYDKFKELVLSLAAKKQCTGELTQQHIEATFINAQRMKRIDKQCELNNDLKKTIQSISKKYTWLLLVESWCGDGAQCVPVIAKMAELNPNIELKLILRDENLPIMDNFLTNGSRSIPKLIFVHHDQVIDTWGPRPKAIQKMVIEYKQLNPKYTHEEFVTNLHLWYAKDKTQSIQNEFNEMLKTH